MSIQYDQEAYSFHLQTPHMNYVFDIWHGRLRQRYWGYRIQKYNGANEILPMDRSFEANPNRDGHTFSLRTTTQEYPAYGNSNFREPAIHIPNLASGR